MAKEAVKKTKKVNNNTGSGMVYCLGLVGAVIYFVQAADGFWEIVLGVLQAIVWPAIVVYKFLESFYGTV